MNDVPFVAFAIASLYFFMRGLRLESPPTIAVSFVLAGIAILTRQTGVALPIAFACGLLAKQGIQPRSLWLSFFIVAIGIGLQFAYQAWLSDRYFAGELQQTNFYNFSQLTNAPAPVAS